MRNTLTTHYVAHKPSTHRGRINRLKFSRIGSAKVISTPDLKDLRGRFSGGFSGFIDKYVNQRAEAQAATVQNYLQNGGSYAVPLEALKQLLVDIANTLRVGKPTTPVVHVFVCVEEHIDWVVDVLKRHGIREVRYELSACYKDNDLVKAMLGHAPNMYELYLDYTNLLQLELSPELYPHYAVPKISYTKKP